MSSISTVLKALQSAFMCIILFYPSNKIVMEVEFACISHSLLRLYNLRLEVIMYFAKGHKTSKWHTWDRFWGLSAVPFWLYQVSRVVLFVQCSNIYFIYFKSLNFNILFVLRKSYFLGKCKRTPLFPSKWRRESIYFPTKPGSFKILVHLIIF